VALPRHAYVANASRSKNDRKFHANDASERKKMFCKNLEDEFDGEDSGEDEVEIVEDDVASGFLVDRVLGGQRNAAGADDDHYEQVEVAQVHDEVTETTHSADRANETHRAIDIHTYIQIYIETDLTIDSYLTAFLE